MDGQEHVSSYDYRRQHRHNNIRNGCGGGGNDDDDDSKNNQDDRFSASARQWSSSGNKRNDDLAGAGTLHYSRHPQMKQRIGDRERSRSRSPSGEVRKELTGDEARRARMARLRAEIDEEEKQLTAVMEKHSEGEMDSLRHKRPKECIIEVNPEELEDLDEDEQMKVLLGFGGEFGSTKGQKVEENHTTSARGAAKKNKARKYRQYMNRKNGFNRPLDKMD